MIYVIKSAMIEAGGYKPCLKIGFSEDKNYKNRWNMYSSHNLSVEEKYKIPGGTEEDEKRIHVFFSSLRICRMEWYSNSQVIYDFFDTHPDIESIREELDRSEIESKGKDRRISEKKKLFWPLVKILLEVTKEDKDPEEILESMYLFCSESVGSELNYLKINYPDSYEEVVKRKNEVDSKITSKMKNYIEYFQDTKVLFSDRLRYLCETPDFTDDEKKLIASQVSINFDKYYNILGPVRCKALGYRTDRMNKEIQDRSISKDDIRDKFQSVFTVSSKYTKAEAKNMIRDIYSDLGINRSPKASDLQEYFDIRSIKLKSPSGKWENGFEILKLR